MANKSVDGRGDGKQHRRRSLGAALAAAVVLGWAGALVAAAVRWEPARSGACEPLRNDSRNFKEPEASNGTTTSPLFSFNPPADPSVATTEMGGRSMAELRLTLPVKAAPPGASPAGTATSTSAAGDASVAQARVPEDLRLRVVKDALRRMEHGTQIPPDAYTAVVQRSGSHAVQMVFCMERDPKLATASGVEPSRFHVPPGSYTGTVVLEAADGTVAASIPITVKVQYQHLLWLAILYLPVTVLAGGAFVYASGHGSGEATALLSAEGALDVVNWLRTNVIHVVAGVVAAVLSFIATAVSNPTFGSDSPKQFFTLLGVTFAGYTTALAAGSASFKAKARSGGTAPAPDPAPSPAPGPVEVPAATDRESVGAGVGGA